MPFQKNPDIEFWTGKIGNLQKFFNDLVFCAAKVCIIFEYAILFCKKNLVIFGTRCKSAQYKNML